MLATVDSLSNKHFKVLVLRVLGKVCKIGPAGLSVPPLIISGQKRAQRTNMAALGKMEELFPVEVEGS